jgi:hypothetical protein
MNEYGWDIVEWKVNTEAPRWLDAAGLRDQATCLREFVVNSSTKKRVVEALEKTIRSHDPHLDRLALKRPLRGQFETVDHCARTGMYFCMVRAKRTDSHPICLLVNWIVPGCQQIIGSADVIQRIENTLVDSLRQFGFDPEIHGKKKT